MVDLGAIGVERGRDHGMPSNNALRQAYGLPPKTSFTAITGEATDRFPNGSGLDNPTSLAFDQLRDTICGDVSKVDAFGGMVAERHVAGAEFGELQLASSSRTFATATGFFYANDPALPVIQRLFGIDYRRTLAQIIEADSEVQDNVFRLAP